MLSEFYIVVEDFRAAAKECTKHLGKWPRVNHIHKARFADLAEDMVSFCENLARAHINATMWMLDDVAEVQRHSIAMPPNHEALMAYLSGERNLDPGDTAAIEAHLEAGRKSVERMIRRGQSQASIRSSESAAALKTSYKAYFFFIRAFHDSCYSVLLNLANQTPGDYSSMNRCIERRVSPIYEQISSIPGYTDWFLSFKRKRDQIKKGQNFSLCGPQYNVGVGFNEITPEGGVIVDASPDGKKFRLGDLISAFRYSMAIAELINRQIPRPNNAINPDA